MIEFEILETKRLILKKVTPETFVYLFENYPDREIKQLLGLKSDEELIKEKEKSRGGYTTYDRTIVAFLLVSKESNETIGRCGYHNWYKEHRKAEIGYALNAEEHKQKGFMGEAMEAIIKYGFRIMDLNRIEASTSPENSASQNLLKKFGFQQEGYLRQHYIRREEIQDSLIFSLLKEDYEALENHKTVIN
jgi:ribosomal-protein-alanine N-acetyltransferase